jgi:hypothetical protein
MHPWWPNMYAILFDSLHRELMVTMLQPGVFDHDDRTR